MKRSVAAMATVLAMMSTARASAGPLCQPTFPESAKNADVIFAGRAGPSAGHRGSYETVFEVDAVYRGSPKPLTTVNNSGEFIERVVHGNLGFVEGHDVEAGRRYVVAATARAGRLFAGPCSGSYELTSSERLPNLPVLVNLGGSARSLSLMTLLFVVLVAVAVGGAGWIRRRKSGRQETAPTDDGGR